MSSLRLPAIFALSISVACMAQTPCGTSVSANVILPDGRLVRHLPPSAFVNSDKTVTLSANSEDESPRRVLIVLETTKEKVKQVLQAEYDLARYFVQNARPEDRFALVTALGKRVEVPFGPDNRQVLESIDSLANGKVRKYTEDGILDSIETSLPWFGAPRFGDAILVIGSRTLENRFSNPSKLQEALLSRGIRVFSVVTGPLEAGTVYSGFGRFTAVPQFTMWYSPSFTNLATLSFATGGYAMIHPELDYNLASIKYDDERKNQFQREAANFYLAITKAYRLEVKSSNSKVLEWKLRPSDELKLDLPDAIILQPRALLPCAHKHSLN